MGQELISNGLLVLQVITDIKSAFPSIVLNQLIHDMRTRGVPAQYTNWIAPKINRWHAILKFDGYESELLALTKGLDQGCPLSGIAFQFYNWDLLDICDTRNGKEAVTFMDNTLLLARGKMLANTNGRIKQMMTRSGGGL